MFHKQFFIFLFMIILFQACSDTNTNDETTTAQHQDEFAEPPITMQLTDGGTIAIRQTNDSQLDFQGLEGRLKLLFFFDITCEPCRAMLPHLVDIQSHYSNHLEIFGILTQPEIAPDTLNTFLQSYNINFKVAYFSETINEMFYHNSDIPYTLLYDLNGQLIADYNGVLPQEMLEFDIRKTLEQNGEEGEAQEELENSEKSEQAGEGEGETQ